jgi:hypothetical protein
MKIQTHPVITGLRRGALLASFILLPSSFCLRALGQSYSINWYKVSGGGGSSASTNGPYSVSGTIGQQDASGALTGGSYSVTGGFWSIIAVVPAAGVPNLTIEYVKPSSVVVSWPDKGSYTLQQNGNLATTNWTASGYAITTVNGTNSITITPPVGNLFFRLANP